MGSDSPTHRTREGPGAATSRPQVAALVNQALISALTGQGAALKASAADLLADHVARRPLPAYAPAFALSRYDDPKYRELLEQWGDSGQL